MSWLLLGLVLFLGAHSSRVFAPGWRQAQIDRWGERVWKGAYSLLSLVGLVLIVWGYGQARQTPLALWVPVAAFRHLAGLMMLVAFVLVAAAYVPRNAFKARVGHPMVLGVKVWALAHLLANHTLADVLLFGAFLTWSVLSFTSSRRRDRRLGIEPPPATRAGTGLTLAAGLGVWLVFVLWAHVALIGVRPY